MSLFPEVIFLVLECNYLLLSGLSLRIVVQFLEAFFHLTFLSASLNMGVPSLLFIVLVVSLVSH